jgi:hypothetical protein
VELAKGWPLLPLQTVVEGENLSYRVTGALMLSSSEYKRKAEDCRQLAKQSQDVWAQTVLLETSSLWDALAAKKAKSEPDPTKSESDSGDFGSAKPATSAQMT